MTRNRDIAAILGRTAKVNTSNTGIDSAFVAARALPGDWSTTTSGNNLIFTYADSNLIKFQDSGTVISIQDIGAFGSI